MEYAHQMPSLCPLTHLLSRTSSVHLFHHLLRLPAVCCSLDIGDSTKFSGVSFFSAQCSLNFLWHCSEAKCFFPTQGLNYWSTESCSKECIQCKGSEDLLFISGDCNVNWKFQCKMPIHIHVTHIADLFLRWIINTQWAAGPKIWKNLFNSV